MTEPRQDPQEFSETNENIGKLENQLMESLILSTTNSNDNEDEVITSNQDHNGNGSELVEDAQEKLQFYCIALDELIEIGKKYIDSRQEVKSLKVLRRTLSIPPTNNNGAASTSGNDRYAVIEDNVPEELKCSVCFEIFEDEVLQCINGHSICSRCCDSLRECPECRVKYNFGKIRNRTVEKLMASLKIDCLYSGAGCREKLVCAEMQIHVETCSFMNKPVRSPEYKEVRKQLKMRDGDSKRLEKRMDEANKRVMESKDAWINARKDLGSHDLDSMEELERDYQLATRVEEMTVLYGVLTELIKNE